MCAPSEPEAEDMPELYIFAGLPGSGKSTLASMAAKPLNAAYLRIDSIEQKLRDLCDINVISEGYELAYALAADNLAAGISVVADSCNPLEITREAWHEVAGRCGVPFIDIEVTCSDEREHRARVETREVSVPGLIKPAWEDVTSREYHAWSSPRLIIDTAGHNPERSLVELLDSIEAFRR